ncbi:MAG TPA: DNA double-strand break repair nuclease NurA [Candidatus Nanoarchaeia archaeon]|nr:DNA double-strand break repair nuclease NurA [Candidatus Nanoarchaeia archaeon]
MFDQAAKKLIESLNAQNDFSEEYPKFSSEDYLPFKIEKKNFHEIKEDWTDKTVAFVDGGSAEIVGSANFSLNIIRICFVCYKGNKKIIHGKKEFLLLVNAENKDGEISYKSSFFGDGADLSELSFSSFDKTLMKGVNRAEIGSIANAVRRFSELLLAKSMSDGKKADIIVLDGNLQCTLTNEKKYMDSLQKSCSENGVVLSALAKTSSLFTDKGNILTSAIASAGEKGLWFYNPVAEIKSPSHKAEMYFAKLHENSRHVFRLEVYNEQKKYAFDVISAVASSCNDAVFVGYPYGLVEADRAARVTNQEKESMKTVFLGKLKGNDISKYINSKNAHEILDRISF